MNIQWYPGHMTKARRQMAQDLKLVDLVIEILDSRAPFSTENPDIRKMTAGKKRLVILGKSDLADRTVTSAWISRFRSEGAFVVAMDSRNRSCLQLVKAGISELTKEKRERDRKRGIIGDKPVKALVCGIPNVGKSTFINSIAGKASARTGDRPGVTKGNQWLNVSEELILLDTPGILWPRFDNQDTGMILAAIGSINDDIINKEELALFVSSYLLKAYPEALFKRYGFERAELEKAVEEIDSTLMLKDPRALAALQCIAVKRGALRKGAEPDYTRTAALLIDDLRAGRLGCISMERPGKSVL